jgi:hypothetical protein
LAGAQLVEPDQITGWLDFADLETYNPAVSTTRYENSQTVGLGGAYPNELDLISAGGATFTGTPGTSGPGTYVAFPSAGSLQSPAPTITLFRHCGIDGTMDFGLYLTNSGASFQHIFDSRTNTTSTGVTIVWLPVSGLLRITVTKKVSVGNVTKESTFAPPQNTPFVLTIAGYYSLANSSAAWPEGLNGDDTANTNGSEFPVIAYVNSQRQLLADATTGTLFTDHMSIASTGANTAASRFTLGARVDGSGNPTQRLEGGSRMYFWRYYTSEILTEAGITINYQASRSRLGL